ncbi:MAG TPA: FAD-binding and (Fe-S)-binding domain-containing protein [Planctomycetota bacterium]|nr:FAD-binding and (Fe-S)-binding domain-containing protein [Planctomycetota bacterium]
MSKLKRKQELELRELFGERVSFRPVERRLYGHDIAAFPSLLRPLVGRRVPDAVVQPASEDELVALVQWASANRVPLTPRGKATSGYGGAVPVRHGVVVDFYRLNRILAVNTAATTVTAQAGVVWERLEEQLAGSGLALRLYPTSFPASTVGGWLAQGGAGIGSFEMGWFRDHVVSARVVLADGEVREFAGDELAVIADAEGTTGLISAVTLHVQPKDEIEVAAVGSPDGHALQRLTEALVRERLPIWSLVFINPQMAELKNRSPLPTRRGQPPPERVLLPGAYITTLAFRARDRAEVLGALPRLAAACDSELLSERIAHHEWEHRSRLMTIKRLGPSLVPTEVVVPLRALGAVMAEIERKVQQPLVEEGLVIRDGGRGEPEAVLLGFIPSDQRKFRYNLVFSLVLTTLKTAEAHGGRAYTTGLYFAGKARQVLGAERLRRLKAFKARVDPQGILNPRKVMGNGLLGVALRVASAIEPALRPFGNYVTTQVGERPTAPVRGVPADVAWYAHSCSQCGYCTEVCPQFRGSGWESDSPRGKWYWLQEHMAGREEWDPSTVASMLACTTCEACDHACSAVLPIEASWMKMRSVLVTEQGRSTFPIFELMADSLRREGNCWLRPRAQRTAWMPEDLLAAHGPGRRADVLYLTGCTACYAERDICLGTARLLDAAGVPFAVLGELENCCGMPMLMAGKTDLFADNLRHNLRAVREAGARELILSCPACYLMWRHTYPEWAQKLGIAFDIQVRHSTQLLAERIQAGKFAFPAPGGPPRKVTWHDACHLGRASGIFEAPRTVIRAVPNVTLTEMAHHHDAARCCGGGVSLVRDPKVAFALAREVLDEARATGATMLLSACPCCQLQLRLAGDAGVKVVDLAHFAAEALGHAMPDPSADVRRLWTELAGRAPAASPDVPGATGQQGGSL